MRCWSWLGGVVHTRRWVVRTRRDDYTLGATMVPRRALCSGAPSGAVRTELAVVKPYRPAMACTRQTTCTACWSANHPVMVRCATDSAPSGEQSRQFSATTARAEYRIHPQPRRKSCKGLRLYGFCGGTRAYAETALQISPLFAPTSPSPRTCVACWSGLRWQHGRLQLQECWCCRSWADTRLRLHCPHCNSRCMAHHDI